MAARSGEAAAEVDLPFVEQSPKPDGNGFFVAGKAALLRCHPSDFLLRDDPAGHRLQEELAERHESHVTKSLHDAVWLAQAVALSRRAAPRLRGGAGVRALLVPVAIGLDRTALSVLPRRRIAALLILNRLVCLPKPFHLSAFEAPVTDPVATTANGIDRGTPWSSADALWLSHGFGKKNLSYRPVFSCS